MSAGNNDGFFEAMSNTGYAEVSSGGLQHGGGILVQDCLKYLVKYNKQRPIVQYNMQWCSSV